MTDGAGELLTYLGPPGSFTHSAVDMLAVPWVGEVSPRASVPDVIFSVEAGEAAAGIVPLESSVEGDVSSTIDELIFRSSICFINEELVVPISYVVVGLAGARAAGVRRLITTQAAAAQCRRFIESSGAELTLVESVSEACARVAGQDDPAVAAIASAKAGRLHALAVLRGVAEDHSGVATRMAVLRRKPAPATGHDTTAVVVTPVGDRTGVLADILACFSSRDIALTSISSRRLRTRLGEYCFLLTARGHLADSRIREALACAARVPAEVKILGCYPLNPAVSEGRIGEFPPPGSVGAATLDSWIDSLLEHKAP
ncbi:MAG: prephenate dehydratase domain-containing protein [Candidatus Nanopelagicales bacterium]|nr:prephenate dehydratase domain-containing protein [Candidatus Nanopelagicales bacterium]MDZ4249282.1 prephenate dehydratase domain-containing protein [Candidatus Nanopelagicales bacterium]